MIKARLCQEALRLSNYVVQPEAKCSSAVSRLAGGVHMLAGKRMRWEGNSAAAYPINSL